MLVKINFLVLKKNSFIIDQIRLDLKDLFCVHLMPPQRLKRCTITSPKKSPKESLHNQYTMPHCSPFFMCLSRCLNFKSCLCISPFCYMAIHNSCCESIFLSHFSQSKYLLLYNTGFVTSFCLFDKKLSAFKRPCLEDIKRICSVFLWGSFKTKHIVIK